MTHRTRIVVVNFDQAKAVARMNGEQAGRGTSSGQDYEYLYEGPLEDPQFAVVSVEGTGESLGLGFKPTCTKASSFSVVRVKGIRELHQQHYVGTLKYVVTCFDTAEYIDRYARVAEIQALEMRMETEMARMSKIDMMKNYAKTNPSMAAMLRDYERLTQGAPAIAAPEKPYDPFAEKTRTRPRNHESQGETLDDIAVRTMGDEDRPSSLSGNY